ncbi:MAG: hypothetical protein FWD38_06205 [Oscillospiraceae bacterium]|nr:hypothetical protein [Oscillospiraceae bacterium]
MSWKLLNGFDENQNVTMQDIVNAGLEETFFDTKAFGEMRTWDAHEWGIIIVFHNMKV